MTLSTVELFKHLSGSDNLVEIKGQRLQALQSVMLMMLSDINEVCVDNGIEYVLGGGTCLGALRHKGFIPWDDDIDINMTRESFDRLATLLLAEHPEKYAIQRAGEGCELAFPRIRLKETTLKTREDFGGGECGVFIDVFIVDNAPDNTIARKLHGLISMALGLAWSSCRFAQHGDAYLALTEPGSDVWSVFKKKIRFGKLFSFMSVEAWAHAWDSWNGMVKNQKTKYVVIPCGRKHYFGEMYLRSLYFPSKQAEFCGLSVPVPADADAYMRALYGDSYMTPPAECDRESHAVYEFDLGKYVKVECGKVVNSDDK